MDVSFLHKTHLFVHKTLSISKRGFRFLHIFCKRYVTFVQQNTHCRLYTQSDMTSQVVDEIKRLLPKLYTAPFLPSDPEEPPSVPSVPSKREKEKVTGHGTVV